jgi:hypothetical protein
MRTVGIGGHTIRLWVLGVALAGLCVSAVVAYFALTFVIPLEVKEPLETLSYPSRLSLFPGEVVDFNVTLRNNVMHNYTVRLVFSLADTTYQSNYVTFSNTTYLVPPGTIILQAWLGVLADAPPANVDLTVNVQRLSSGYIGRTSIIIMDTGFYGTSGAGTNYVNVTLKNNGTKTVTLWSVKVNNVVRTIMGNLTLGPGDYNRILKISNVGWVLGNPYKIDLYDSNGQLVASTLQNAPGA